MPELQFKGKTIVRSLHLALPYHELLPQPQLSHGAQPAGNLIIQGDNLLALKALLPRFAGQVRWVYIDPPYNTGHEGWVYNDNVNSPLQQAWLRKVVDRDDLSRHDKWLCMMLPRLRLLRELLREDGAIGVSIGDDELHHVRLLLDEVFGAENFRNLIVLRRYDKNLNLQFAAQGLHSLNIGAEYVLIYARSPAFLFNPLFRETAEQRRSRGYWKGFWNAAERPRMRYPLLGVTPERGQWKWQQAVALEAVKHYQQYLAEYSHLSLEEYWQQTGETLRFIRRNPAGKGRNAGVEHWVPPGAGALRNSNWSDLLASTTLTDLGLHFDNPKHPAMLQALLQLCCDPDDLVLDSFAGSGSTAQALLALNAADGGRRRFILVEQEDYAESLTAERVRRVMAGWPAAKDPALRRGYGGSFSFFRLGAALDFERMLSGDDLPSYESLARYVFFTATGIAWDEQQAEPACDYLGSSGNYEIYLIYRPDLDFLRDAGLTRAWIERLPPPGSRRRLVFAPAKYLDDAILQAAGVEFAWLPFEIYRRWS
jgi:adenine-specific DNA-methyltransferase